MITSQKKFLLLFAGLIGVVLVFILLMVLGFFSSDPSDQVSPTPTPRPGSLISNPKYSKLEKTAIGETTENELKESNIIISQTTEGAVTIYQVRSETLGVTDEIWTQNGIVVSERINTFNKKVGYPPKITSYANRLGEPDEILNEVSPLGKHISAHIYAKEGVTFFCQPKYEYDLSDASIRAYDSWEL